VKIGLYLVSLHDRPLSSALDQMVAWGIRDAEVAAGGFVPTPHCPTRELVANSDSRQAWLEEFTSRGVRITALNCNGSPLHPDPRVGPVHQQDILASIRLAALIGVDRVVVMPGGPGSGPEATRPTWSVAPWETGLLDVRDYQWSVAVPYWTETARFAAEHGVRLCLEMHPHTVVYNTATLVRLIEQTGADNLGANLDPSHLFWQGIDPIVAIGELSGRIWQAAAKDTILDAASIARYGVLDDRFTRVPDAEHPYPLGEGYSMTQPPKDAPWRFASAGRGHDSAWWGGFIAALQSAGYDDSISIEHEDWDLPPADGIPYAAATLSAAIAGSAVA
jgi:sugar phosphate isomerase/epimerase